MGIDIEAATKELIDELTDAGYVKELLEKKYPDESMADVNRAAVKVAQAVKRIEALI